MCSVSERGHGWFPNKTPVTSVGHIMSDSEGDAAPVVCAIAHPLADAKLAKKVLKVVKKGTSRRPPDFPSGYTCVALTLSPPASFQGEVRASRRERGGQSAAEATGWVRCPCC